MKMWVPFNFDGNLLTAYKSHLLREGSLTAEVEGKYVCTDKHILGIAIGSNDNVVFVVKRIPFEEDHFSSQETVEVVAHWILDDNFVGVDGLSIRFPELDYFLPVSRGVVQGYHDENRTFSARAVPFDETKIEFGFMINEVEIKCSIGVVATLHTDGRPPISLESVLYCKFPQTNNLQFINGLIHKLRVFFSFVCYRRSIDISLARLSRTNEDGKSKRTGMAYWPSIEIESDRIIKETSPASLFGSHIGDLIQLISDEVLYVEHIPETRKSSSEIDASRFVLISAAFEWNANKYLNVPVSESSIEIKADIIASMGKLLNEKGYTGKRKEKFYTYHKMVENHDMNLSGKIFHALKQYRSIIEPFIANLYGMNGISPASNSEIGDRIQAQRNNYAHGNIDKVFDSLTILDVLVLEWLIYCIVLKNIGLDDNEIRAIINKVFRRNFAG